MAYEVSAADAASVAAAPYRADGTWRFGRLIALLEVASLSRHAPAGAGAGLRSAGPPMQLAVLQLLQPQSRPAGSGAGGRQPRKTRGAAAAAATDTRLVSDVLRYTAAPLLPAGLEVVPLSVVFALAVCEPVMSTVQLGAATPPSRAAERAFWVRMGGETAWTLARADWWRLTAPRSSVG